MGDLISSMHHQDPLKFDKHWIYQILKRIDQDDNGDGAEVNPGLFKKNEKDFIDYFVYDLHMHYIFGQSLAMPIDVECGGYNSVAIVERFMESYPKDRNAPSSKLGRLVVSLTDAGRSFLYEYEKTR